MLGGQATNRTNLITTLLEVPIVMEAILDDVAGMGLWEPVKRKVD